MFLIFTYLLYKTILDSGNSVDKESSVLALIRNWRRICKNLFLALHETRNENASVVETLHATRQR